MLRSPCPRRGSGRGTNKPKARPGLLRASGLSASEGERNVILGFSVCMGHLSFYREHEKGTELSFQVT